jgi:hypothetical protein
MVALTRPEFDAVYARLGAAGYRLVPEEEAWRAFSAARESYAQRLEQMAAFWIVPSVSWFGGSDPLRSPTHHPEAANHDPTPAGGPAATDGSTLPAD